VEGHPDPLKSLLRLVKGGYRVQKTTEDLQSYRLYLLGKIQSCSDFEAEWSWPATMPTNMTEVYSDFKKPVLSGINKNIKFGFDRSDIVQTVWSKLMAADILRTFIKSGRKHLPKTLTARQAVDFLGISWSCWSGLVPASVDGVYTCLSVLELDSLLGDAPRPFPRLLPESAVSYQRFISYLKLAASNHTKNILRTHTRRFQLDTLIPDSRNLTMSGSGYRLSAKSKEGKDSADSWESRIVSQGLSAESLIDIKRICERHKGPAIELALRAHFRS
jgi:hypothetical protein